MVLGSGFGAIWCQLGSNLRPKPSQNRPKLVQKSIKNCIKIWINFLIDFCLVWGRILIDYASKLEGRKPKKYLKNNCVFSILTISANLPTRCHMIEFLANLALNLRPKTLQNSTQDASKIDQKGHQNHDASWFGIWTSLWMILGRFWRQVGREVGPKLANLGQKSTGYAERAGQVGPK